MLVACSELLQNGNNNNHHLGCYCQIAVTVVLHSLFLIIMCLAANIIIRRRRRAFAELARERNKRGVDQVFPGFPIFLVSVVYAVSSQQYKERWKDVDIEEHWQTHWTSEQARPALAKGSLFLSILIRIHFVGKGEKMLIDRRCSTSCQAAIMAKIASRSSTTVQPI